MARQAVRVSGIAPPAAYYSHGIAAPGGVLYVAGQVPLDPGGHIPVGAEAQARQVLDNLAAVVRAAGASLDDVVKTTVFLTDLGDRTAVGRVREEYFTDPPPANTLVVVSSLANPAFLVEIEAVVAIPSVPGGQSRT
ncbi:MAG: RidA family protein [Nitriliruptorales bacterium]|nr:RidA family protein [Nitriliruptorales bacterium]